MDAFAIMWSEVKGFLFHTRTSVVILPEIVLTTVTRRRNTVFLNIAKRHFENEDEKLSQESLFPKRIKSGETHDLPLQLQVDPRAGLVIKLFVGSYFVYEPSNLIKTKFQLQILPSSKASHKSKSFENRGF